MAFPVGVLDRGAAIEAIEAAPSWERFEIRNLRVVELGDDSGLVYSVVAQRAGQEPYSAVIRACRLA